MNIVLLANNDGGLYQFRKELIERLSLEYTVICAVPDEEGYINDLEKIGCECKVLTMNRRGTNPISDLKLIRTYINLIKDKKPIAVLTYTIKPNVYGGIAARIMRTPYIANITGLGTVLENGKLLGKLLIKMYKIGLKKANCVFFQNSANKVFFVNNKIYKGRTSLIPGSGVNTEIHKFEEYPKDDDIRFLFVGRIMKDKGIDELLLAMSQLHNIYPSISLDIVGGCDEDYEDVLEKVCSTGFVRYHGLQHDVHFYYMNTHCTVLPSYHEGMANVLLESASTGRPVIATRIPGCRETFDEGVTGLGCETKDVNSLYKAMLKFVELPLSEKKQMGINGRKKVEKDFDRKIVIKEYLNEIERIIHN